MRTETGQTTAEDGRDGLFALLTHRRRRRVLAVLRDAEEPLTLEEVAAELAGRWGDPEREHLDRVRLSLHHWHLPKLAAAGAVDYDAGERTVSLSERAPGTALAGTDLEVE